jgi:hypothetical protein
MQMLAKAQNSYIQSKTSDLTSLIEQPKPIGNWPNDYHLNTSTYVKPEAIRMLPSTNITSPTSSTSSKSQETLTNSNSTKSSQQQQHINPIIQRLLSFDLNTTPTTSSTTIISTSNQTDVSFNENNSNSELISLDLKRKLNIIKLPNDEAVAQQHKVNLFSPIKNLMTVKDFEANLLANENNVKSSISTISDNYVNVEAQLLNNLCQTKPVFYLDQQVVRPNKLLLNDGSEGMHGKYKQQELFSNVSILLFDF